MAEHMRVWKADDPNSPFADGGAFQFQVTDADDLIKEASENFVHHQGEAWKQVRRWADDQMEIIEVEPGGSPNGPGASLSLTENLRTELPKLWARHDIRSVLDVACGDWNWLRYVDLSGLTNYFGWDIDPELIERCKERVKELRGHETRPSPNPHTWFEVRNIIDTNFPNVDCILARHILMHLPNDYITAVLEKMKASHAKYLLTSNFPSDTNDFVYDPTRYAWIGYMEHPVNLEVEPFNLDGRCDAIDEAVGPAGVLAVPHELVLYKL